MIIPKPFCQDDVNFENPVIIEAAAGILFGFEKIRPEFTQQTLTYFMAGTTWGAEMPKGKVPVLLELMALEGDTGNK